QAEDGIRDGHVTGVQTCALPIFSNGTRPIVVSADRPRLIQVFWNLLHNAVKFSHKGGRVRVTCEAGNGDAVIRIEDVGRGIPPRSEERRVGKECRGRGARDSWIE